MPAPISEARLIANRKNAQNSSGPKTDAGKTRSRANAVKHGLTGAGIALPTEDAAAIEARFVTMQEDLQPKTLEGALLVRLAAFMSIQIERGGRHETALLARVRRHAATDFELARLAEIDRLFETIETNPRDHHRRLQTSIEGVDLLLGAMQAVRDHVESGYYKRWTPTDRTRIDLYLGGKETRFPVSRCDALLMALQGNLDHIPPREQEQLPQGEARVQYFRDELILLVDVERARLAKVRATIDPSIVEDDRREAAECATLAASPEAVLAKKYTTAAIGTFLRALRDFHKLEKAEAAIEDEVAQPPVEPEVVAQVASPVPATPTPIAAAPAPLQNEPKPVSQSIPLHYPLVGDPYRFETNSAADPRR